MTKSFEATCRMCKGIVVAKFDTECPVEWMDKLLPMLTCQKCYDRLEKRRGAEDRLYSATKSLQFEKLKDGARERIISRIRIAMIDYARWFADECGEAQYHFSDSLVDDITQDPNQLFNILAEFRKRVRAVYFQSKNMELTNA